MLDRSAMMGDAQSDSRTEPERFEESVSGADLIEGDRISKQLVARNPAQLGERIVPDGPETQLIAVTLIDRMEDTHEAILVDTETETFIRAGRHDSSSAWSQKEADWTVHDAGSDIKVTDAEVSERPEQENDQSEMEYMNTWVDVLFGDLVKGVFDYRDEVYCHGNTLKLADMDGRQGYATVELVDED